ncbi:NAD(P)-dependent oxidoreductase [Halomonas sp. C05BenzN]|uniref:NAD(P)-dependent oxidoreductase n=1 Tax=Halomonas sp. C05BenzN TaxID=3411041 RepID=UPI003B956BC9
MELEMKKPRVGFIGLGLMGQGMAENILNKGFPLTVMAHRNRSVVDDLCSRGASEVTTPAEMARHNDIVIICVGTSEQVESLVLGEEGLLSGAHAGLTIVDCSTSLPSSTLMLSEKASQAGVKMIDAPLARTPKEAREGRLNVMVGGDSATLDRVRPVLEAFSENIFHIGPTGSAHKLKLINNFLVLGTSSLVAEASVMAEKLGVDHKVLLEVCSKGGANSAMLNAIMPWVIDADDSRMQFSIGNAAKDLRYLREASDNSDILTRLLPTVHEAFSSAEDELGSGETIPKIFDSFCKINDIDITTIRNQK